MNRSAFDMTTFNGLFKGGNTTNGPVRRRRNDRELRQQELIDEQMQLFAANESNRYDDNQKFTSRVFDVTPRSGPGFFGPESPGDVSMMSISPPNNDASRSVINDVHMEEVPIIDLTKVKDECREENRKQQNLNRKLWSDKGNVIRETVPFNVTSLFNNTVSQDDSITEHSDHEYDKSLQFPNEEVSNSRKKTLTHRSPVKKHRKCNPKTNSGTFFKKLLIVLIIAFAIIIFLGSGGKKKLALEQLLNIKHMERVLRNDLIGQENAIEIIVKASKITDSVMLFVGGPGVGKSFASKVMSRHYLSDTIVSPSITFPGYKNEQASSRILEWLKARSENTTLFIFEDLHSANNEYKDAIAFALNAFTSNRTRPQHMFLLIGLDTRQHIAHTRYVVYKDDAKQREDMTSKDVISSNYDYLLGNGLSSIVTDVVPFLPMERDQVVLCVERELRVRKITVTENNIDKVIGQLTFYPPEDPFYCITGCRKVPIFIDMIHNFD